MGVIADALAAAAAPKEKACPVIRAIEKFRDDEDYQELLAAINNPEIPYLALSRVMNQIGVRLERRRLWDHRSASCTCSPPSV